MKKLSIIITLIISLLLYAALAWAAPVGKISALIGNVDVTPAGEKQAKKLTAGDEVSVGDIVRTKSKSKAEISFNNGNMIRLAENTRLKISGYLAGKDNNVSVVNLLRGKIQNTVKTVGGVGGRYEVHTPSSVCGVRGTIFYNTYLNGTAGSFFEEGDGYGYNPNMPKKIQTIEKGRAMIVPGANLEPQLRDIVPGELKALQMDTNPAARSFRYENVKKVFHVRNDDTLNQYKPAPGDTKPYVPPSGHHTEPYEPYYPEPPYNPEPYARQGK